MSDRANSTGRSYRLQGVGLFTVPCTVNFPGRKDFVKFPHLAGCV